MIYPLPYCQWSGRVGNLISYLSPNPAVRYSSTVYISFSISALVPQPYSPPRMAETDLFSSVSQMRSTVSCTQSIMNEWFCKGPKSISLRGAVKSHGMWWSHSPSPRNSLFHSLERRHRRRACSVFSAPVMWLASPVLGTGQIRIKQSHASEEFRLVSQIEIIQCWERRKRRGL